MRHHVSEDTRTALNKHRAITKKGNTILAAEKDAHISDE